VIEITISAFEENEGNETASRREDGAGYGDRTRDIELGKLAFYR
jgi:hypothetical protein